MKLSKTIYLHSFAVLVVILALFRCGHDALTPSNSVSVPRVSVPRVSVPRETREPKGVNREPKGVNREPKGVNREPKGVNGRGRYTRKYAVNNFKETFPDSNEVQLVVAKKYGVKVVQNRQEAEKRKSELVYVGANPYFYVDKLRESIPYLVPRANTLLQDIGRAFYDSLYVKGIPLHKIIITSVLRTEEDVARLRKHNQNASENSCHRFGTTFDICQNRYKTVQTKDMPRRQVTNDTLKWVLSEVLRDMRQSGRCYIKYEVKQGCFHITTR